MRIKMASTMVSALALVGSIAASVRGAAASAPGTAAAKYSSPAAVVAAYEKAHDAGDDAAGIDCLSPEGLDRSMKFMLAMEMMTRQPEPGAPAPSAEEKAAQQKEQAQTDALLAKHGIKDLTPRAGEDPEALVKRITANVTDERGLVLGMMKMMQEGAKQSPCRKGELKDLKITGDSATAKYVTKESGDSTMSQDLKFKQIDGSWRLADVLMLSSSENGDPAGGAGAAPKADETKPTK